MSSKMALVSSGAPASLATAADRPASGTAARVASNAPGTTRLGSEIEVRGLSKRYGDTMAVDDISFTVSAGEFLTLLGASGSGKSTTLMMIAGFVEPTAGTILLGGRDIAPLPPEKRNLGVVFQNYALFPHMNVFDNIAFPLKMRHVGRAEIERKVSKVLELVELGDRRSHRVSQLSGGQQQRVALARALVFEPPVLLMDEPMGALDRRLREQLQREVMRIQRSLGLTVISVTHDQEEALLMSDRIAIMADGAIQQIDSPQAIYRSPRNPFVAAFLGDSNFLRVCTADLKPVAEDKPDGASLRKAMIRPEDIHIVKPGTATDIMLAGSIRSIEFPGGALRVAVATDAGLFEARLHHSEVEGLGVGDAVTIGWRCDDMVLFDA
ncbi:ABC transporter ATP-binding protein [Rhodoligotrophos defluvii]|uniref:ABC transporter ATP-binding protein n=1 Tax=Rhodoligotrophos defluvii TaxID=2561934 RepID=UPI001EF040F6|nr:ABC transporter ATP-binding protein [Rhodoligotrophos defluvii]